MSRGCSPAARLGLLIVMGSLGAEHVLCGAWASVVVAHRLSMWNLPGPGMEPVSPALAGIFLTIGPPGKSSFSYIGNSYNFKW